MDELILQQQLIKVEFNNIINPTAAHLLNNKCHTIGIEANPSSPTSPPPPPKTADKDGTPMAVSQL